jgi:hypothetical protein
MFRECIIGQSWLSDFFKMQRTSTQLNRIAFIGVVLEIIIAGSSMKRMQTPNVPMLSKTKYSHSNFIGTKEI